jgi:hypothetical protein
MLTLQNPNMERAWFVSEVTTKYQVKVKSADWRTRTVTRHLLFCLQLHGYFLFPTVLWCASVWTWNDLNNYCPIEMLHFIYLRIYLLTCFFTYSLEQSPS